MGSLLYEQGEYEAARPLLERALAIRERVLGQTTRTRPAA
ncbi:MAG: tetratricopeptide repeat protein [Chloroflexota bacterium]